MALLNACDYMIVEKEPQVFPEDYTGLWENYLNQPVISVIKRTKKSEKEIDIKEGDSAFDQLLTASMIYEIPVDYNGSKVFSSIYVKAIAGMAEFDYGNMSGWTYSVNGEFPNVSCSAYKLSEGDYVRWIYTDDGKVGQ